MIRKAIPKDASRLAEILIFAKRTAYRPIFRNDVVSFQEMQVLDLALYYRDTPDVLDQVVVYDDGIIKGMMSWDCSTGQSDQWQLRELYIDPFFQHQGIGGKLMEHFLAGAVEQGNTSVFLWVLEKNRAAQGFYRRYGFESDGEKALQPGTEEYLVKYIKNLDHGR